MSPAFMVLLLAHPLFYVVTPPICPTPMNRVRCLVFNAASAPRLPVPEGMDVGPGTVVACPLVPRTVLGIVWEAERLPARTFRGEKLRPCAKCCGAAPLARRCGADRVDRGTTIAPLARSPGWRLEFGGALKGPATTIEYRLSGGLPERMTRSGWRRSRRGRQQATIREWREIAGVSEACCAALHQGVLEPVEVDCDRPIRKRTPDLRRAELTPDQAEAPTASAPP